MNTNDRGRVQSGGYPDQNALPLLIPNNLPEAWVPLRPLESYEKLAFRSQLPPEARLLVVFSSNNAFLLDDRYRPQPATHPEELMAVLLRVEIKVDQVLDSVRRFLPPQPPTI